MNYDQLVREVNEGSPVKICRRGRGLGMVKIDHPISITESEFGFIRSTIVDNNLKVAFECASAFGVSALAIGLGLKETGGILVSMDAFVEQRYGNCSAYGLNKEVYEGGDGLASAEYISRLYGTPANFYIGWSPDDTAAAITKYTDQKLDFVMIDAGHFDEQLKKDLLAIKPFLADRYALFSHDRHCYSQSTLDFITENFGPHELCLPRDNTTNYELFWVNKL